MKIYIFCLQLSEGEIDYREYKDSLQREEKLSVNIAEDQVGKSKAVLLSIEPMDEAKKKITTLTDTKYQKQAYLWAKYFIGRW